MLPAEKGQINLWDVSYMVTTKQKYKAETQISKKRKQKIIMENHQTKMTHRREKKHMGKETMRI